MRSPRFIQDASKKGWLTIVFHTNKGKIVSANVKDIIKLMKGEYVTNIELEQEVQ